MTPPRTKPPTREERLRRSEGYAIAWSALAALQRGEEYSYHVFDEPRHEAVFLAVRDAHAQGLVLPHCVRREGQLTFIARRR